MPSPDPRDPLLCPGRPLPYLLHGRHGEPAGQMEPREGGPKTDSNRWLQAAAWANPLCRLRWREGRRATGGWGWRSPTLAAGLGLDQRGTPPPLQHRATAWLATVAWGTLLSGSEPQGSRSWR